MLPVTEYFAKSLKVIRNNALETRVRRVYVLLVHYCRGLTMSILYHFCDSQHHIMV